MRIYTSEISYCRYILYMAHHHVLDHIHTRNVFLIKFLEKFWIFVKKRKWREKKNRNLHLRYRYLITVSHLEFGICGTYQFQNFYGYWLNCLFDACCHTLSSDKQISCQALPVRGLAMIIFMEKNHFQIGNVLSPNCLTPVP